MVRMAALAGWVGELGTPAAIAPGCLRRCLSAAPTSAKLNRSCCRSRRYWHGRVDVLSPSLVAGLGRRRIGEHRILWLGCAGRPRVGSYAASLAQPIFEGSYLRNNLRYAKSEEKQALISYAQTIQRAGGA